MRHSKLLEIRDRGTMIVVLATQLDSQTEAERYLLGRAGYGSTRGTQRTYILLTKLNGGVDGAHTDPFAWPVTNGRTMRAAHLWIREHFNELHSGDVVDVEFNLGERPAPKPPERLEYPELAEKTNART